MGSSLDYLRNVNRQLAALGIRDDELLELLRDTEDYCNSRPTQR